ncbi:TPA: hypothetical protein ACH3X2_004336 [Trebouxia sp. C0005]
MPHESGMHVGHMVPSRAGTCSSSPARGGADCPPKQAHGSSSRPPGPLPGALGRLIKPSPALAVMCVSAYIGAAVLALFNCDIAYKTQCWKQSRIWVNKDLRVSSMQSERKGFERVAP